jgi:hypothetical protein
MSAQSILDNAKSIVNHAIAKGWVKKTYANAGTYVSKKARTMTPEHRKNLSNAAKSAHAKKKAGLLAIVLMASIHCFSGHPNPEKLADAIYRAEGGSKARSPYGVLSVKVKNSADARRVTINSIEKNWKRWEKSGRPDTFIDFMADRWCPISTDAKGNKNWKKNVSAIYNSK